MEISMNLCNGESSTSDQNRIFEFRKPDQEIFDYLLFFDSRGLCVEDGSDQSESHLHLLMEKLKEMQKSFICISRPKNLTTFVTLVNFLMIYSDLNFSHLITNQGFVDCTPKKQENMKDLELQFNQFLPKDYSLIQLGDYKLSNGEIEPLFFYEYGEDLIYFIADLLEKRFTSSLFLNTPLIDINEKFARVRPPEFYSQLQVTNDLVKQIAAKVKNGEVISLDSIAPVKTFDAVHFKLNTHKDLFNLLQEYL